MYWRCGAAGCANSIILMEQLHNWWRRRAKSRQAISHRLRFQTFYSFGNTRDVFHTIELKRLFVYVWRNKVLSCSGIKRKGEILSITRYYVVRKHCNIFTLYIFGQRTSALIAAVKISRRIVQSTQKNNPSHNNVPTFRVQKTTSVLRGMISDDDVWLEVASMVSGTGYMSNLKNTCIYMS
jgi:hypothetical protein